MQAVPLVLSLLIFLLQFYLHPYKDTRANYMESFVLLVLVVLVGLGNTTSQVDAANDSSHFTLWPIYYIPVIIGGVATIVYAIYQIW